MQPPEVHFSNLCRAEYPAPYLRDLADSDLAALISYLRETLPDGTISGLVLGMAEMEAVERFLKQTDKA